MSFSFTSPLMNRMKGTPELGSVLQAVASKIFRTLYIYIYIFFLRIHRHSKSRDEVRAQSRKTPAHGHTRGHTIVVFKLFITWVSTDAPHYLNRLFIVD